MPFPFMAAATVAAPILGSLFGGGDEEGSSFEPTDVFTRLRQLLPNASPDELMLAALQMSLAGQAFGAAGEELPEGLSLASLAGGKLPGAVSERIHTQAFAPVNEGIRQATRQAEEMAASRGIAGSTIEQSYQAELIRPLLAQAAQTEAALGQGELERLGGLRERALGNMLAMQQSPALDRLLQIRLAEATQDTTQMSRPPGDLPGYAYPKGAGNTLSLEDYLAKARMEAYKRGPSRTEMLNWEKSGAYEAAKRDWERTSRIASEGY